MKYYSSLITVLKGATGYGALITLNIANPIDPSNLIDSIAKIAVALATIISLFKKKKSLNEKRKK